MLSDKIDKEVMEAAGPQLKLISTLSVGFDHVDLKTAREKNIKIGYTVRRREEGGEYKGYSHTLVA